MTDFQSILNKWNIKADINTILSMWNESHRSYHNLNHLSDVVNQINEYRLNNDISEKDYEKLLITALYHDIIYKPGEKNNEELSADFFYNSCQSKNLDIKEIKEAIIDTKEHISSSAFSKLFNSFDMNVVKRDFESLLEWEMGIWDEYQFIGKDKYKEGRIKFLESIIDKYPMNSGNISELINWVKNNY